MAASVFLACTSGNGLTGISKSNGGDGSGPTEDKGTATATDPSTPGGEGDTGTDEPIWMNASYLTCSWEKAGSLDTVMVRCGLRSDAGIPNEEAGEMKVSFVVKDSVGQIVTMEDEKAEDSLLDQLFTARPWDFLGKTVQLTVQFGAETKTLDFAYDKLQGMEENSKLRQCLGPKPPLVKPCFDAAGIEFPVEDDDSGQPELPAEDGADPTEGNGTVAPCSGKRVGEHCWYLGAAGKSCLDVCGKSYIDFAGTKGFAGSGGSVERCQKVLEVLGAPEGQAKDAACFAGIGCAYEMHAEGGSRLRCTSPATTAGISEAQTQRACACTK